MISNLTPKEELQLYGHLTQETQEDLALIKYPDPSMILIDLTEARAMYPDEDFMVKPIEALDYFISHYRGKFQGEILAVRAKFVAVMEEVNQQAEHGRECLDSAMGMLGEMES